MQLLDHKKVSKHVLHLESRKGGILCHASQNPHIDEALAANRRSVRLRPRGPVTSVRPGKLRPFQSSSTVANVPASVNPTLA